MELQETGTDGHGFVGVLVGEVELQEAGTKGLDREHFFCALAR